MIYMIINKSRNKKTNELFKRVYSVWKNMIDRCYKPSCAAYKNYGANGVMVCDRWNVFDNFIQDVDKIDGFDLNMFLNGELTLDKDKNGDSREYSLDKCCWMTKSENNKYKPNQQRAAIAVDPYGKEYIFYNQSLFAKEHCLSQSKISECLNGKRKSHKRWKFIDKSI